MNQPSPDWSNGRLVAVVENGHRRWKRMGVTPGDYRIEDRGHDTPCWIWQLTVGSRGYGQVGMRGRRYYAHRLSWEQQHGPVPDGLELDHLCRVRACVRPSHLEAVTHAENVRRSIRIRQLEVER